MITKDDLRMVKCFYFTYLCNFKNYTSKLKNSSICLLYPPFKTKIKTLLQRYVELDPNNRPAVFESFRSNTRQIELYNLGVSGIKSNGYHHFGLAVDIVFIKDNNPYWEGNYKLLDDISLPIGLHKTGFKEQCHFQMFPDNDLSVLRNYIIQETKLLQTLFKIKADGIIGPITLSYLWKFYWSKSDPDTQKHVLEGSFT